MGGESSSISLVRRRTRVVEIEGAPRSGTRRTPSLEMPPGKRERAKPLAWDQDVDFRGSDRPRRPDLFNIRRGPAAPPAARDRLSQPIGATARSGATRSTTEPPRAAPVRCGAVRCGAVRRGAAAAHHDRRGGRSATGGCNNSVSRATSRSLVGEASMVRSSVLVRAGGTGYEPGCSSGGPTDVLVSGALRGLSGEASGAISRGWAFFG